MGNGRLLLVLSLLFGLASACKSSAPGSADAALVDAGIWPDASISDTGIWPDATIPDAGVLPDATIPETGILPDATIPDSGILPDASILDSGVWPDATISDTGIWPDATIPDSGVWPDATIPDSGIWPDAAVLPDSGVQMHRVVLMGDFTQPWVRMGQMTGSCTTQDISDQAGCTFWVSHNAEVNTAVLANGRNQFISGSIVCGAPNYACTHFMGPGDFDRYDCSILVQGDVVVSGHLIGTQTQHTTCPMNYQCGQLSNGTNCGQCGPQESCSRNNRSSRCFPTSCGP